MAEPSDELPIVDASPFIILAQGGRLDLLRLLSERVRMPVEVEGEIRRRSSEDAAVAVLDTADWIEVVAAGRLPAAVRAQRLDAGEAAVLTWALTHPGAIAILDDRRGRRAARALGIPVVGTLGLVLDAKRRGVIPAARPVIEHFLRASG